MYGGFVGVSCLRCYVFSVYPHFACPYRCFFFCIAFGPEQRVFIDTIRRKLPTYLYLEFELCNST